MAKKTSNKKALSDQWFRLKKWKPFDFQRNTWREIAAGKSGLLNSPTGSGKTMAIWFGVLESYQSAPPTKKEQKLHCLWITPLRALSKEILLATKQVSTDLGLDYKIALRTGDTGASERARQLKKPPQALITTPESIHVMLSTKGSGELFSGLKFVIVDEWHELLGSKRGVQVELALSRLRALNPGLIVWGISATIGNLGEAKRVLLGKEASKAPEVRANIDKVITIKTIYPDVVEKYSWVGHLGIKLLPRIIPVIEQSGSTLLFVNVRSQAEIWYQKLIEAAPHLAGVAALHHGSLSDALRKWVEDELHKGKLKVVVCTSSLDLGVDFHAVDTVVQVGSAKGIARFIQRAGRSGHYPGAASTIYFVPTNSLEIVEASAFRYAIENGLMEDRIPYVRSFDVLVQYLVTLAVGEGFKPDVIWEEVRSTHCFSEMTRDEFDWCLRFITTGGGSLSGYDEFHKVVEENGVMKVVNRGVATRHRLSIGTIVSDSMMQVKLMSGKRLGVVEESFLTRLNIGDTFWFSGRNLELVSIREMEARVKPAKKKSGAVPSWLGGRLPLSAQLSRSIRNQFDDYRKKKLSSEELTRLAPLLDLQNSVSAVPMHNEVLIEQFTTRDGFHLVVYPFEGRFVHEGMAAILAHRIAQLQPFTFSIGMNDYGFELLSDKEVDIDLVLDNELFSPTHLYDDALRSLNATEAAMRRFRDIATIAGLVFTGYPGKEKKTRHLQASAQLFFKVFEDYDKDNLLLRQAYDEVLHFQLEMTRMQEAFRRMSESTALVTKPVGPTPFAFPILVDTLREKYSNEDMETRLERILKDVRE